MYYGDFLRLSIRVRHTTCINESILMLEKTSVIIASTERETAIHSNGPNEVVPVLLGQGHEGASHHDELDLVHAVSQLLQLFNSGIKRHFILII